MAFDLSKEIERAEHLRQSGKTRQAARVLRDLLSAHHEDFDANFALGNLYHGAGRNDLALPSLTKAVSIRPDAFEAVLMLGIVEHQQGRVAEALVHMQRAAAIRPDSARAHSALGVLHLDRDDLGAAHAEFGRAVELQPANAEINTRMASLQASSGEPEQAAIFYRNAISHEPLCGDAHYGLAFLGRSEAEDDDVLRMEAALQAPDISKQDRILTGFALAKALHDLQRYEQAFEILQAANRLQRESIEYSLEHQRAFFRRHIAALNEDFIAHCKPGRLDDETPLFVLGMPRSGTSLVEQILASHPDVHGAGEVEYSRLFAEEVRKLTGKPFPTGIGTIAPVKLRELGQDYITRLKQKAGPASRVVDKLPHNFLRIGLFAALMPNAKIVLCERGALDNCLSIYQHHFSAEHAYASDLAELGEYYKLYADMMTHWQAVFPGRIHVVRYEDLVEDTGEQVRQLLQFCDLPFAEACVSFHETQRIVNTPSALQVRRPVYRDSLGSAAHYERQLQSLIDAFASQRAGV